MDSRIRKMAKLLVDYSCEIKKGDWFYLSTDSIAGKPLYDAVRSLALQRGAHVSDHFCYDHHQTPGMLDYMFLKHASKDQLKEFPRFRLTEMEQMQAYIRIEAAENPQENSSIDPGKIALRAKAVHPVLEERLKKKWVVTMFPTQGLAQEAGMSLEEFEDFVFRAVFANKKDPVKEWQKLSEYQQGLVEIINTAKRIRILGPETDLTLSVEGRIAENCDGHLNMPDGEVFTSPVENSANGKIFFATIPSIIDGREVGGIRLEFREGKVVAASAEKGNEFLQAMLNTDKGSRYLGELGIGTNFGIQRSIKHILFDEKIGGTIHLALGDGFPELGGKNKSAIHWDIILDLRGGGEISVDGHRLTVKKDYIGLE